MNPFTQITLILFMFSLSLHLTYSCIGIRPTKTEPVMEIRESCVEPYVRSASAITSLKGILKKIYFGQHIADQIIPTALYSHLKDENPSKALVLSFHGTSGVGKSYMYRTIINALFQNGLDSDFVRIYLGPRDFRERANLREYQDRIERELNNLIRSCPRALIIFEEVDMMPPHLLDVLVPYLDGVGDTRNFKQTKAIYILTSNQNAEAVYDITMDHYLKKLIREDLTFRDFHDALRADLFNAKKGGFKKAKIISKNLIDYYIPFLPLERKHVIQCIEAEMAKHSITVNPEEIANNISFTPNEEPKIYSAAGCRHVEILVKNFGIHGNPFGATPHSEL